MNSYISILESLIIQNIINWQYTRHFSARTQQLRIIDQNCWKQYFYDGKLQVTLNWEWKWSSDNHLHESYIELPFIVLVNSSILHWWQWDRLSNEQVRQSINHHANSENRTSHKYIHIRCTTLQSTHWWLIDLVRCVVLTILWNMQQILLFMSFKSSLH